VPNNGISVECEQPGRFHYLGKITFQCGAHGCIGKRCFHFISLDFTPDADTVYILIMLVVTIVTEFIQYEKKDND